MPKSYARLLGRGAVVTGASSGIGRAVALAFSAEGARVVLNYRQSQSAAEALVSDIEAGGADCLNTDVTQCPLHIGIAMTIDSPRIPN